MVWEPEPRRTIFLPCATAYRRRRDGGSMFVTRGRWSFASDLHPVGEPLVAHTMRESPIRLQRRMTSRVAAWGVMQSFINSVE
jgi:hypothetical protein